MMKADIPAIHAQTGHHTVKELHKYLFFWCVLWILIAILAFFQDVIHSFLNHSRFIVAESVSYKSFWLLFIPVSWALLSVFEMTNQYIRGYLSAVIPAALVLITSLAHLFIFSVFLWVVSNMIHHDPWQLYWLLTEKLSSRLYIDLTVYSFIAVFYFRFANRILRLQKNDVRFPDILTIRNGKKSEIVKVDRIKCIKSDGAYVTLFTTERKYVMFRSLKNLMNDLNPDKFKRIHRSSIVNIDFISSLKSRLNGDYDIILNDGTQLRLSRNYVKSVKGILL